jgi:predicted amidohydrolase YtcJ
MTGLLIRRCEVDGIGGLDVRIRDGVVVEIEQELRRDAEELVDGGRGALIPGLHDHHLHLLALAAALGSVNCGPGAVRDVADLAQKLRGAAARGPVRGVGYFESVAGALDRDLLDGFVPDVPVRVQHRSGSVWFLNSAALVESGLADSADPAIEHDAAGRATGRLTGGDRLLQRSDGALPDLAEVGRLLASYGVTGVTDATPQLDGRVAAALHMAQDDGALPQRMLLLGAPLEAAQAAGVPWKIVVDEARGLDPAGLLEEIHAAHVAGRPVAIHCTSRAETVLAVTVLHTAGPEPGDRLEHAGVLPIEFDAELARTGVTVVTQPHFIAARGDGYLENVEPSDHALLYRCGSLIHAGVAVAAGTDAPFESADPWSAITAAVQRRTQSGIVIAARERVSVRRALELFLGPGLAPGGPPRRISPGTRADLCLLDARLDAVLADPRAEHVAATIISGHVVHHA